MRKSLIAGYAAAVTLSAFLLFQVEPIMGKLILPWFGGSAAVWTTAILFFQFALVAGYGYAHLLVRVFSPRAQVAVHVGLLLVSLAILPIIPDPSWRPVAGQDPTLRILGLLTVTVGAPFALLSTTGPLIQAWYARLPGARPYRLFALSNAASLLGLLSYPILVEPRLTARHQAIDWSLAYVVFAALIAAALLSSMRAAAHAPDASADRGEAARDRVAPASYALWIVLAACPSLLFLAVTNELSQNVAPIPLIWVLPLSIYLLSFILCFEAKRWYRRRAFLALLPVALGATAWMLSPDAPDLSIFVQVAGYAVALFVFCMVCHGELARRRPPVARLTAFYLMVSLGGAAGGLFVAVLAPQLFSGYFELPLGLVACAVLALGVTAPELLALGPRRQDRPRRRMLTGGAGLIAGLLACTGLALYLAAGIGDQISGARVLTRDFYGSLIAFDTTSATGAPTLELSNGTTDHGEQYLQASRRRTPTTYYGRTSGIGLLLSRPSLPRMRVGVIGLGAGTIATYGRAGDYYRFYEINPQDIQIARSQFSFLSGSPARTDVVTGDARLSLAAERSQRFDVLAADAFSGDSIPVHLLTRQALQLYFRHLAPGGVLAVHVSNQYLNLAPIVARTAATLGRATLRVSSNDDDAHDVFGSDWVLVSADRGRLQRLALLATSKAVGDDAGFLTGQGKRAWTDDYSDVLEAL